MGRLGSLHPHHDDLRQELRSWFTTPAPEIGYDVVSLWCGHLADLGDESRFIVSVDDEGQVPRALAEVAEAAEGRPVTIWVDDRRRAARLDGALVASGCVAAHATTHLALVGPIRDVGSDVRADLVMEQVDDEGLEKLYRRLGFDDEVYWYRRYHLAAGAGRPG